MNSTILSVDLAKDVFEVAQTDQRGKVIKRHRLPRNKFSELLCLSEPGIVLIEACGSAHYWGRVAQSHGHKVRMLPAQYVAPYRRRGKSDRIDTDALLEAHRCDGITEVPVRTVDQQQIQQLHRIREQWKKTRVQRINGLRGCLRELGFAIPLGVSSVHKHAIAILEDDGIPPALKSAFAGLLDEINRLEESMKQCERDLKLLTKNNDAVQRLQEVPGIGLMTSTAMVASIGTPHRFSNGRKLASWLGLTPREHSSGNSRSLGRITKQGDGYIRCLLTHGARSVLVRAKINQKAGIPLNKLQQWGLTLSERVGHNKATCAMANKLARIAWAVWCKDEPFKIETAIAV